jgi:hypothetical protein
VFLTRVSDGTGTKNNHEVYVYLRAESGIRRGCVVRDLNDVLLNA